MKKLLLVPALLTLGLGSVSAGTICPAGSGATPFPHNPDNAATGCNAVIVIAANGTATTVVNDTTPYENSEDVLVGVVNNSSSPLSSINLSASAGNDIFGVDGDGICTFTFVGNAYCATGHATDPADYFGPTTSSFSNVNSAHTSGTVNFSTPIAPNGGTTFFSLEGIPANFAVTPGPPSGVPEPGSITLLAIGLFLVGVISVWRRFARS